MNSSGTRPICGSAARGVAVPYYPTLEPGLQLSDVRKIAEMFLKIQSVPYQKRVIRRLQTDVIRLYFDRSMERLVNERARLHACSVAASQIIQQV
jgi:hypothetical protein